jgi:hypothetical protein
VISPDTRPIFLYENNPILELDIQGNSFKYFPRLFHAFVAFTSLKELPRNSSPTLDEDLHPFNLYTSI